MYIHVAIVGRASCSHAQECNYCMVIRVMLHSAMDTADWLDGASVVLSSARTVHSRQ